MTEQEINARIGKLDICFNCGETHVIYNWIRDDFFEKGTVLPVCDDCTLEKKQERARRMRANGPKCQYCKSTDFNIEDLSYPYCTDCIRRGGAARHEKQLNQIVDILNKLNEETKQKEKVLTKEEFKKWLEETEQYMKKIANKSMKKMLQEHHERLFNTLFESKKKIN